MFSLFDEDKDGYLSEGEFKTGLLRLFGETFEQKVKLVYDLFDFDLDGKVSKEDIRTLLSHVPLAQVLDVKEVKTEMNSNTRALFIDRLQSQEELVGLLDRSVKQDFVTFPEFAAVVEQVSSTVFLCVVPRSP